MKTVRTIPEDAERILQETGLEPVCENAAALLRGHLIVLEIEASDAEQGHAAPISARPLRQDLERILQWCEVGRELFNSGLGQPAFGLILHSPAFAQEGNLETLIQLLMELRAETTALLSRLEDKEGVLRGTHLQGAPLHYGKPPGHLGNVVVTRAANTFMTIFNRRPAYNEDGPFVRFLHAIAAVLGLELPSTTTIRSILKNLGNSPSTHPTD